MKCFNHFYGNSLKYCLKIMLPPARPTCPISRNLHLSADRHLHTCPAIRLPAPPFGGGWLTKLNRSHNTPFIIILLPKRANNWYLYPTFTIKSPLKNTNNTYPIRTLSIDYLKERHIRYPHNNKKSDTE